MTATIAALLVARAEDDHVGLRAGDASWTWAQVVHECAARAELLATRRRDGPFHVGVLLDNVPEYVFLLGGAALAGATVVGINPTRRGGELADDVRHTDCQLVVTDGSHAPAARPTSISASPPTRCSTIDDAALDRARSRRTGPRSCPCSSPGPTPSSSLIFTSGSTGRAQGRARHPGPVRGRSRTRWASPPTTCFTARCRCSTATHSRRTSFPASRSGATIALRRTFSASDSSPTSAATARRTSTPSAARSLHPRDAADRATTATTDLKFVLAPESSATDMRRVQQRFGRAGDRRLRLQRGRDHDDTRPIRTLPKGSLGRAPRRRRRRDRRSRDRARRMSAGGHRRARRTPHQRGRCDRRDRAPRRDRAVRGLLQQPGSRRASAPATGGTGPATSAIAIPTACSGSRAATPTGSASTARTSRPRPSSASWRGIPDVAAVAVYAVPDPVTGDQVMAAIELHARTRLRAGGVRDIPRRAARPRHQVDAALRARHRRAARDRERTSSTSSRYAPTAWVTTDPVWWAPERNASYRKLTTDDVDHLDQGLHRPRPGRPARMMHAGVQVRCFRNFAWVPSCSAMWWRQQKSLRLFRSVGPPFSQWSMWWASQNPGGTLHPLCVQCLSRADERPPLGIAHGGGLAAEIQDL